jgi:farnesyl diphosphate synthase
MLARASGAAGMAGGQALDLEAPGKQLNEAEIITLQAMKTGALLTFACEAGAVLGEASAQQREALRTFGAKLGTAFQLADDLLDVEGDAAIVGKATGKDAEAGKATLVSLLGADAVRARLRVLRDEALQALTPFQPHDAMLAAATDFVIGRNF